MRLTPRIDPPHRYTDEHTGETHEFRTWGDVARWMLFEVILANPYDYGEEGAWALNNGQCLAISLVAFLVITLLMGLVVASGIFLGSFLISYIITS